MELKSAAVQLTCTYLSAEHPRLQLDQLNCPVLDAVFADGQDMAEPDVERNGALHEAD